MALSVINMRKGIVTTLGLMIIALFLACGKYTNVSWVFYNETQCGDPWERTNNNEVLKNNITEHFKSKGVRIFEIEIFTDASAQGCTACHCTTGRVIKVKVKNRDVDSMEANGFHK
jgi:hypothetical protein